MLTVRVRAHFPTPIYSPAKPPDNTPRDFQSQPKPLHLAQLLARWISTSIVRRQRPIETTPPLGLAQNPLFPTLRTALRTLIALRRVLRDRNRSIIMIPQLVDIRLPDIQREIRGAVVRAGGDAGVVLPRAAGAGGPAGGDCAAGSDVNMEVSGWGFGGVIGVGRFTYCVMLQAAGSGPPCSTAEPGAATVKLAKKPGGSRRSSAERAVMVKERA